MTEKPKCAKCNQPMEKTATLKAAKSGEKLEIDVFACFQHNFFATVKRPVTA